MADRRRRSPEASSSRRRGDSRRSSEYDPQSQAPPGMRSGAESIYSSSSSSYEFIDISHSFPPNRSGIATFFTAPSERRRLRRRKSNRLFKFNNSSSSSINSDLAYGHGYLKRPKRKVRSRKGKEIDRERYSERERVERHNERYTERNTERFSDRERERSGLGRATTDAEILAVGAGLAKLAREQNKLDLKAGARGGKRGEVFGVNEFSRRDNGMSRGLGPSKVSHGSDRVDEDGWESASEADSESSVDSKLAFGAESQVGWSLWGRKKHTQLSRKSSVVDPQLFGPANSLHGFVDEPVGFGDVSWNSSSDFGQRSSFSVGPAESIASGSQQSLQRVYPIATNDSTRFETGRSSVSGPEPYISRRPDPIPIQQPQPITPVSQSVYEPIYSATRTESGGILKKTSSSSGRGKSLAEAALAGVAGAAIGAAISSERKDDRKDRRRDDDRVSRTEDRTVKRRDDDRDTRDADHTSKRRDSDRKDTKDDRKRDKHDSPDREQRREKRREKERSKDSTDEPRKDKKRETRREEKRSERSEVGYDDRRSERSDGRYESRRTKSETAISKVTVDPFQYQVDNDAFDTPNNEPVSSHRRIESVPAAAAAAAAVYTVDREPDFTRNRSSSIKEQVTTSRSEPSRKEYSDWDHERERSRNEGPRDRPLHEAELAYEEIKHSTAPIDPVAMGAAIVAEGYRESRSEKRRDERRGERRRDYDDYDSQARDKDPTRESKHDYDDYDRKSRDKESTRESKRERDPIQEEADRAYREIVMARKIASQVIRSRSPSPNRSVVDKYEDKQEEEIIRIVTPPGMDDEKKVGKYDAPNADFQLDHVLQHPRDLRNFSLPSISPDHFNPEAPYLKKDPDADLPRPLLNLVLPTPSPSPMPEKQAARSEPSHSEPSQSEATRSEATRSDSARSEPAQPSRPKDQSTPTSASDIVISPKGNVVSSPSTSTVSKGVTWGENETKHFEVESPSEHRDEFVSSPEMRARDNPVEQPKPNNGNKRSGWSAIAAGIIGAGVVVTPSSETSKTKENEKQEAPYEYRGVVVEPESQSKGQRQRSPPTTGPKPSSAQSSRVPGSFDDDLDFAATVAAGLQDTGFDPNIVINDPSFRRRDSPPGSNEPNIYRAPFAETVSDLGSIASTRDASQGFVMGEVATTPKDWSTASPAKEDTPMKPSKKEGRSREKATKRKSGDSTPLEESSKSRDIVEEPEAYFETLSKKEQKKLDKALQRQSSQSEDVKILDGPSAEQEMVEEPESYIDETLKKKSKKSKKSSASYDDDVPDNSRDVRKVSVPVDAFDDLRNGEDEWNEPSKSKKKSKRNNERFDSPSRSVASEIVSESKSKRDSDLYDTPSRSAPSEAASELERSSSKKSKDKSRRKSEQYEPDPTEISLPPSTPSENSRDDDFEDSRKTRKSSIRDSGDRGDSRSVVSADASRYDDDETRKSKRKSKTRDDFDDTRSVASAPAGDEWEDGKKKKKDKDKKNSGGFFGIFGSKSEVGANDESPKKSKDDSEEIKKKSKKPKRSSIPDASSLYDDTGAQSVGDLTRVTSNGNGNGSYHFDDDQDRDSRGNDSMKKKSRSRSESTSSKKDSFLGKAGTLGAGVGLAGAAAAIAAQQHRRSQADNAFKSNEPAEHSRERGSSRSRQLEEIFDPEITQRQFRPSIDPQYGDLLPLPPSDPVSPNVEPVDDLPDLPDSRPETPEIDRLSRERPTTSVRKSIQDTPMKSPSQSAVPLKFIMGNRSNPSSPGAVRASPMQSPATPIQESLGFSRSRPRPTSWDSTKEFKPLYLVESNRRGSTVQQQDSEEPLPPLPPSQTTSRSSSQLDSEDDFQDVGEYPEDIQVRHVEPLSIDTALASTDSRGELLDSQQSTPKAGIAMFHDAEELSQRPLEHRPADVSEIQSLPAHRPSSPKSEEQHGPSGTGAEIVAGFALVSALGYFASSPSHSMTEKSFSDELPSHSDVQRRPSPVDPMTKDRSSYLLQSSPMSRKTEEDDSPTHSQDSPSGRQKPFQTSGDVLHSIQERDGNDIFDQSREFQPLIEQERERTFHALSGLPHDQPIAAEVSREADIIGDGSEILPALRSAATDEAMVRHEPAEFSFTMSKKDKKKDKKKSKGISRSSTQDDFTTPEAAQEPLEETPDPLGVEPAEFSVTKSKKEGKGLSRSSTQDNFSSEGREIVQEASITTDVDPTAEISTTRSRKDKKKDKKKGKSLIAWEPEEDSLPQTPEEPLEISRDIQEEVPAQDDFVAAESKKSKKKEKKRGKSVAAWAPEEEVSSPTPTDEAAHETSQVVLEAASISTSLDLAESIENRENKDAAMLLEPQEEDMSLELGQQKPVFDYPDTQEGKPLPETLPQILPETVPEAERDLLPDSSTIDDFSTSKSKKGKNKERGLSTWELEKEQQKTPSPAPLDPENLIEVVPSSAKKSKKGKKSQPWTPEEILPSETVGESTDLVPNSTEDRDLAIDSMADEKPVIEDFDQFVDSESKKSKKKSRKSQSRGLEPESSQGQIQDTTAVPDRVNAAEPEPIEWSSARETFEDFTESSSKKGKGKSRNTQILEEVASYENTREISKDEPLEHESAVPASGSFSSAAALLPLTAAGATALAVHHLEKNAKDSDDNGPSEVAASKDLDPASSRPSLPDADSSRPLPDGLKAGYDNEQLSLARQLQEEFGSGSKKSKKDKKKRQSLPSTPDRQISRSRDANEVSEDHHRARSLSIGVSPDATRFEKRPVSEDRKIVYSEDQLELARQLKAEFESGNKKSKKDKKKRTGLSRSSTQDDFALDQTSEEPKNTEPELVESATRETNQEESRDGLAAGYQEDQLSLARQLQAEFGSGSSKRSKKDKKRRSTSQTPTQEEPDHQADYFGDFPQPSNPEPRRNDTPAEAPQSGVVDKESVRDGLAVGYSEDQLELARQLKEEFSSGSKKGKKDTKRQSLLRNNTEDAISADYTPRDSYSQDLAIGEAGPSEPTPAELEEEPALALKKSKKDKKDKKRQSLLRTTTEDDFSSDYTPRDVNEPRDFESNDSETVKTGLSEPSFARPNDEFALVAKKDKKDKKGKKRESLIPTPDNNEIPQETTIKGLVEAPDTENPPVVAPEAGLSEQPGVDPEDELAFTTKKSKKDRKGKKRESLVTPTSEELPPQTTSKDTDEPVNLEDNFQRNVVEAEAPATNPEDEFTLTRKPSKKGKKGKKRENLLSNADDDISSSDHFGTTVEVLHSSRGLPAEEVEPVSTLPVEEEWGSFATKKSKKDKKKRHSLLTQEDSPDQPTTAVDPTQLQLPESGETSTADATALNSATESNNEPADEFAFSSNKSKKDKKKRQSLLRSSTLDDTPEPQPQEETSSLQESSIRDLGDNTASTVPLADEQADEFGFTPKKSKRDKKKNQSIQQWPLSEDKTEGLEESKSAQQGLLVTEDLPNEARELGLESEVPTLDTISRETALHDKPSEQQSEEPTEEPEAIFGNFEFTTKKSKKDKKKRKDSSLPNSNEPSGVSTPIEPIQDVPSTVPDTTLAPATGNTEQPLDRGVGGVKPTEVVVNEVGENPADEWGSFSTKKSKKDKKKRKDLSVPNSNEPSRMSTPIEPVQDAPSTVPEATFLPATDNTEQPLDEGVGGIEPAEVVADEVGEAQTNEWDSLSIKKSREDKKKRTDSSVPDSNEPTGVSTPIEPIQDDPPIVSKATLPSENLFENTKQSLDREVGDVEPTEVVANELVEDPAEEWGSFSTKKSKKDKKNRKSGLSTPIEEVPLETETTFRNDLADVNDRKSEQVEAPVDEEWDSSSAIKKSKKDKKKPKSGVSTPSEETVPALEVVSQMDLVEVEELGSEKVEDPVDVEWGAFTSKKSKKNKKKTKSSGLSTPLEETLARPDPPFSMDPAENEVPQLGEPVDEEWGSFTTKKSKKDKKRKSGLSIPLDETLPEPELTAQNDLPEVEVLKPQLDEPVDDESSNTKKATEDKSNNSGASTALGETLPELEYRDLPETEGPKPQAEETLPKQESPSQRDFAEVDEPKQQLEQPVDDGWASFTTKKFKKEKKNKSGLSTSVEETHQSDAFSEEVLQVDQATADAAQQIEVGGAEWGSFIPKQSKKDKKKRKSGLSTPLEETFPAEITPRDIREAEGPQLQPSTERDLSTSQIDQALTDERQADDAFGFTAKTSKKDKRKSGFLTPVEATLAATEAEQFSQKEPAVVEPETQSLPLAPELEPSKVLQEIAMDQDAANDDFGFAIKKSKKDKKKRKSGVSTPIEENLPPVEKQPPQTKLTGIDEPKTQPLSMESEIEASRDLPLERGNDQEATDGAFEMFTKKTKKDKKKRKSGVSSPIEETLPTVHPEKPSHHELDEATSPPDPKEREIAATNEFSQSADSHQEPTQQNIPEPMTKKPPTPTDEIIPTVKSEGLSEHQEFVDTKTDTQSIERGSSNIQTDRDPSEVPNPEIAGDSFEFKTTKPKKDKKGKRASRVNSENSPGSSATPPTSEPPTDVGAEDDAFFTSERLVRNSVLVEEKSPAEQQVPERETQIAEPIQAESDDIEPFSIILGRKSSTKDKRKRQATTDASMDDDSARSKAPLTSWADEIEEAEVERKMPVIEDIAKDESLSHIASTTERAPIDDFSRPTKKGKKGKKRNSSLIQETSEPVIPHPPIGEDSSESRSDEHTDIPVFAAVGAALTGAALLAGISEQTELATSANDPPTSSSPTIKEVEPPTRKLSKKEKRKISIDRRSAVKDDLFYDDALWEGETPRAFEESKDVEDDAGSDGFWSSPNRDDDELATEKTLPSHDNPPQEKFAAVDEPATIARSFSPTKATPAQESSHDHVLSAKIDQYAPCDLPRLEQQPKDLPDVYVAGSSRKEKKEKDQNLLTAMDSHQEQAESIERESTFSRPPAGQPRAIVEEPHVGQQMQLEQPQPTRREQVATSQEDFTREPPTGRDFSFQDDQFQPRSSSRYSHLGASSLPVVREESLAPIESDEFKHPSYPHASDVANRDSGFVTESPIPRQRHFTDDEHIRDSGVHLRDFSPSERSAPPISSSDDAIARMSWPAVDEASETVDLHRSQRTKTKHHDKEGPSEAYPSQQTRDNKDAHLSRSEESRPARSHQEDRDQLPSQRHNEEKITDLHRTQTLHRSQKPESLVKQRVNRIESPDFQRVEKPREDRYGELNSSRPRAENPRSISDNSTGKAAAIVGATAGFAAARQASWERRPESAQARRSSPNINRLRTPDLNTLNTIRPESVNSNRSSGTPPLRRSDRKSGDLRSLSQRSKPDLAKEAELAAITAAAVVSTTTANPTANEGRVRAKEMADVYDGFGEGRMGSPRSPTRPHSMRRRQSMQVLDLESRLEQLATENRMLAESKDQTERALQAAQHASSSLVDRDNEIESLKRTLTWLQNEVTRLTEVNDGLTSANITMGNQHNDRYNQLESQHAQTSRELQEVRDSHTNLSQGMEGIVRNQVKNAVQDKDREIAQLRAELEATKEQIREMQRQILASKANDSDFLVVRDEDYFDNACQALCQRVQQWVLRFSKFSDMRACRLTSEINNDKIIDRLDNAILDGSDVDDYLSDRVKRRDVFMSMTMTMVWEFVFTRYLFGMDREQRQKLKSLEKLLSEVGPASAVHQWRATTLTLLSKREAFIQQREQDTLAVVNAVLETLTEILPPPSDLEDQIQEQLIKVMKTAVDLSIEMRTQRAEYMMLPPLQPEYDANGDLASKVSFNAALMNERSGDTVSNEELEAQRAVVRVVLFPLVVKKGDDSGEGDDEIVVCPAQVLVAKQKKQVRVFSPGGQQNHSRVSMQSTMPADYGDGSVI